MIFILFPAISQYHLGRPLRKGWRQQKAVTIESIEIGRRAAPDDARQIVGKSGAHVRAHLNNLRFAKSRVQRVSGIQQLNR
jgi:hypothetical protein